MENDSMDSKEKHWETYAKTPWNSHIQFELHQNREPTFETVGSLKLLCNSLVFSVLEAEFEANTSKAFQSLDTPLNRWNDTLCRIDQIIASQENSVIGMSSRMQKIGGRSSLRIASRPPDNDPNVRFIRRGKAVRTAAHYAQTIFKRLKIFLELYNEEQEFKPVVTVVSDLEKSMQSIEHRLSKIIQEQGRAMRVFYPNVDINSL